MTDAQEDGWNDELSEEVSSADASSLVVYSRDWTVETILRQVERGNIDLNPKFQRRHAWNDVKRSKLIESLIIGIPVPEIVLAEVQGQRKSFIVIDGKQRLLALAGFAKPDEFSSWTRPKLKKLTTRTDLNDKSFSDFDEDGADARELLNADVRCTVISNYSSPGVLYDIFYRLNTGSVPLSSHELRQVLNRGDFADYLIDSTNSKLPLHDILNLDGPDNRLRDAEIVLRFMAFSLYGQRYGGNLTPFLDWAMAEINRTWDRSQQNIEKLFDLFNVGSSRLIALLGQKKSGRKHAGGQWESRFNRALFEVQVYYLSMIPESSIGLGQKQGFQEGFERFCTETPEFLDAIESSTKNMVRYWTRFDLFRKFVSEFFDIEVNDNPLPSPHGNG